MVHSPSQLDFSLVMNIGSNQITTFRHRIAVAATESTRKELKKIHPLPWSGDEERLSWVTQLPLALAGLCAKPQGSLEEAGPDQVKEMLRAPSSESLWCEAAAALLQSPCRYLNSTKAGAHDRNDLPQVHLTLSASSTETSSAFTFRERRIRSFPAGKRGLRPNLWRCTRHHLALTSAGKTYNPEWLWYPTQHFREKLLQGSRRILLIHPTSKSTVGRQQVTRQLWEFFIYRMLASFFLVQ